MNPRVSHAKALLVSLLFLACSPDVDTVGYGEFTVAPPPSADEHKAKDDFAEKMRQLVDSTEVPSTLAGAFFQLSRAYLSGRDPESDLEADAFQILTNTSEEVRTAIARTLDAIDAMPEGDAEGLYGTQFIQASEDDVLTVESLATAVGNELIARAALRSVNELNIGACIDEERPGLPRVTQCPDVDGDYEGFCNAVCRISTPSLPTPIRTGQYVPTLSAGDYLPFETEQTCEIDAEGVVACETVAPPNCAGNSREGTCLAVPTVEAGETVLLHGFNFFDVNARVQLSRLGPAPETRETDAHVCGDVQIPAASDLDCSIRDLISFEIPADIAPGRYSLNVAIPNTMDDPNFTHDEYWSLRGTPVLQVMPPTSATFQLNSEVFSSFDETNELFSDEIGLNVITVPITAEGALAEMESITFEFGNVDEGHRRQMNRSHFQGSAANGFGFAVVGYEIDNREAYEQAITGYADAFMLITSSNWGKISEAVGTVVGGVVSVIGTPALGSAVGAALTLAINAVVAIWAPADLVIEDFAGIPFRRIAELTSLNFADPPIEEWTSSMGIDVMVAPCEDTVGQDRVECEASAKSPNQYRERRQYRSEKQGSTFQITFRYNRVN